MRLCPKCGKKTQEIRCPDDGTATLVLAQNPSAKLEEGTEVNGRYRLGQIIGQGGFGAVYNAKNIATDQEIAIKLLAVSLDSDDSDMIQRFFAEAQVTASLKHPNTIRVFDFGQAESGALYIAMELLNGKALNEELKARLAEGRVFEEEEIITIGSQVLRSLSEAHMANLVHRDLKPHNIYLHQVEGDDAVVKVLDFGIAKRLGSNMTGTGKAFGTPTYMSPEQAQNRPLDRRSDLYSLGCVLYQLAAGRPPFDGENPLSVLLSHVAEAPPDLHLTARTPVSDAFVRVVNRAMAKDTAERFNTAMEMRQALEACRGADRSESSRQLAVAARSVASASGESGEAATAGYDAAQPARTLAYQITATPRTPQAPIPPPPLGRAPDTAAQPAVAAPTAVAAAVTPAKPGPPPSSGPPSSAPPEPVIEFVADPGLPPLAQTDLAPPVRAASKAPILLIAAGLLVVGVVAAAVWSGTRGGDPAGASPAAAANSGEPSKADQPAGQADPAKAEAATAAAAKIDAAKIEAAKGDAPKAEPASGAPASGNGQAGAPAAGPVYVDVNSDPPGAEVVIGGDVKGKTPFGQRIQGDETATVTLRLDGYADKDVDVTRRNAPSMTVSLRKLTEAEAAAAAKKKEAKAKKTQKKDRDKGPDDTILDKRLEN